MPTRVTKLRINTIGSVDTPACQEARVALFKRQSKPTKTEDGVAFPKEAYAYTPDDTPSHWKLRLWETPEAKETPRQIGMAVAALGEGFRGNKVEIPEADLPKVKAKVRAAWLKVHSDKAEDDLPEVLKKAVAEDGAGAVPCLLQIMQDQQRRDVVWDLTYALEDVLRMIYNNPEITDKPAATKQALDEFVALMQQAGISKQAPSEGSRQLSKLLVECVTKRKEEQKVEVKDLPEEVQKKLQELEELKKQKEEMEQLAKKNEELEKRLNEEVEKREISEYIAKARGYDALPVKPEEFGPVLRSMAKSLKPEEFEAVTKVLAAANESAKQAKLFKSVGSDGDTNGTGDSAVAKATSLAKKLVEADPGLTMEKALAKVWLEHKELYEEYMREERR